MIILKGKHIRLEGIRTVAIMADPGCRPEWRHRFPPLLEHIWRLYRPGLFLVAGDLAVNAARKEYRDILSALEAYPAFLAAVPGDHDRPLANFRESFGSTRKVIDAGEWRFIGLNTADRRFSEHEAQFLSSHIRSRTVIISHVPPGMEGWTFHSMGSRSSARFLSLVDRHKGKIHAAFFGHIHGYSRLDYSGVPLVATGGAAEALAVRNNRYAGPGIFQMMILHTASGRITLCRMRREPVGQAFPENPC